MSENKPMVDNGEMKRRRTLRKKLLNCLVLIENQGKPTQDLMYELRKAKEALTYWNSDTHCGKTSNGYSYYRTCTTSQTSRRRVQPINTD